MNDKQAAWFVMAIAFILSTAIGVALSAVHYSLLNQAAENGEQNILIER